MVKKIDQSDRITKFLFFFIFFRREQDKQIIFEKELLSLRIIWIFPLQYCKITTSIFTAYEYTLLIILLSSVHVCFLVVIICIRVAKIDWCALSTSILEIFAFINFSSLILYVSLGMQCKYQGPETKTMIASRRVGTCEKIEHCTSRRLRNCFIIISLDRWSFMSNVQSFFQAYSTFNYLIWVPAPRNDFRLIITNRKMILFIIKYSIKAMDQSDHVTKFYIISFI